ncbi:MAG: DUF4384 domain-containing protein [Desulfomonilaceae bacterium]
MLMRRSIHGNNPFPYLVGQIWGRVATEWLRPLISSRKLCVVFQTAAILCITAFAPGLSLAQGTRLFALSVGVAQFKDSRVPSLTLAAKDARDFYQFLEERKHVFASANLTLLVNKEATRANISSAIRNKLGKATKDDIVIIYLSGHGAMYNPLERGYRSQKEDDEFYFITHDADVDNLYGTALLMNDQNLFKGIQSDRCLLLADACHAGGFTRGLAKSIPKSMDPIRNLFQGLRGRVGIASSSPSEQSFEKEIYGNSIFTHFLMKGLRGEAVREASSPVITVKQLYDYVAAKTREASDGKQNPLFYASDPSADDTPVFVVPTYGSPLNIKVQFQYEAPDGTVRVLEDGTSLKSGQHFGVAFRAESDCYLYIFWRDSTGQFGQLYPNPQLTEGTAEVKGGKTYWLPSMNGERWYVLDDVTGEETIYVVASRQKNKKLEDLSAAMMRPSRASKDAKSREQLSMALEREINLMGIASYTVAKNREKKSAPNRAELFQSMESDLKLAGADCFYKITFRHVNR